MEPIKPLAHVLLVDDRQENLLALQAVLDRPGLDIHLAHSGNEALALMLEHDYALVLLDVQMPEMDGFETATLMRSRPHSQQVPIIFVTAINKDQHYIFQGYEKGAVDYLFKPLDDHIVRSKVEVFVELYLQRRDLQARNIHLQEALDELHQANMRILKQQKSVIEEERLKLLVQLAGTTFREIDQPLTVLLRSIDKLMAFADSHPEIREEILAIQQASEGLRLIGKISESLHIEDTISLQEMPSAISEATPLRLLYVEDSLVSQEWMKGLLTLAPIHSLSFVDSLQEARQILKEESWDLLLLDYLMADGTAFDLLEWMKKEAIELPVVVITGQGDEIVASRLIQAGVMEYISKLGTPSYQDLLAVIGRAWQKGRMKGEIRKAMSRLADMAIRDSLTGLYNRRYFNEDLAQAIIGSIRYHYPLTLAILDLDDFKQINDSHGHPAGDHVLAEFARLLVQHMRSSDSVVRFGGEEFAVIFHHTDLEPARIACERFCQAVASHHFHFGQSDLPLTVSIGLAGLATDYQTSAEEFIITADLALYQAKHSGKNRLITWCPETKPKESIGT